MHTSFYSDKEIQEFGFKEVGNNVLISKNTSIYCPENITIGNHVRIDDFCVISGGAGIQLGNFIHVGCYSALFGGAGIVLEDFSGLSARVSIYSESDDFSGFSLTNPMIPIEYKPKFVSGKVTIERHVIIGSNSTIFPNLTLEEGAAIGAHSLVSKSCCSWSVYSGIPARKIKDRNQDLLHLEQEFLNSLM